MTKSNYDYFIHQLKVKLPKEWGVFQEVSINGYAVPIMLFNPTAGAVAIFLNNDNIEKLENDLVWILNNSKTKDFYQNKILEKIEEPWHESREFVHNFRLPHYVVDPYANNNFDSLLPAFQAVTVFTSLSESELRRLLKFRERIAKGKNEQLYSISSFLSQLSEVIKDKDCYSKELTSVLCRQILPWIAPLSVVLEDKTPNKLNSKQWDLINSRTENGFRRIKGSAGSGKSLVLAERAAKLLIEGKRVLMLTYNITTVNYLNDLVQRALKRYPLLITSVDYHNIQFRHFHGLLKQYIPYSHIKHLINGDKFCDIVWVNEVAKVVKADYDAILIDEGQDWEPNWWTLIKLLLKPKGEMVVCADASQNLYGRSPISNEEFKKLGFTGRWVTLEGNYRLPASYVPFIQEFIKNFFDEKEDLPFLPEDRQSQLDIAPVHMRWIQIPPKIPSFLGSDEVLSSIAAHEVSEISNIKNKHADFGEIDQSEVVFLAEERDLGKKVTDKLLKLNPLLKIHTTFYNQEDKYSFHPKLMGVKGSTVKSFKGFENRAIIFPILYRRLDWDSRQRKNREIYVGLTRIASSSEGSLITVVCQDPYYKDYGALWAKAGEFIDLTEKHSLFDDVDLYSDLSTSKSNLVDKNFDDHLVFTKELSSLIRQICNDHSELSRDSSKLVITTNIDNSSAQNLEYLQKYFPSSFCESYLIIKKLLKNQNLYDVLNAKPELNILSYGCGTGGDLFGMLMALNDSRLSSKSIRCLVVDGNKDALNKLMKFKSYLERTINLRHKVILDTRQFLVDVPDSDFAAPLRECNKTFDIIETSKLLNELVCCVGYQGEFNEPYLAFEKQLLPKFLATNGFAVVLDVPIKVNHCYKTPWGMQDVAEWTPIFLHQQTQSFLSSNNSFRTLIPIPCGKCSEKNCYTSKIFTYTMPGGSRPEGLTTVSYRVLVRNELYERLMKNYRFANCYRTADIKFGKSKDCSNGDNEKWTDGYSF